MAKTTSRKRHMKRRGRPRRFALSDHREHLGSKPKELQGINGDHQPFQPLLWRHRLPGAPTGRMGRPPKLSPFGVMRALKLVLDRGIKKAAKELKVHPEVVRNVARGVYPVRPLGHRTQPVKLLQAKAAAYMASAIKRGHDGLPELSMGWGTHLSDWGTISLICRDAKFRGTREEQVAFVERHFRGRQHGSLIRLLKGRAKKRRATTRRRVQRWRAAKRSTEGVGGF